MKPRRFKLPTEVILVVVLVLAVATVHVVTAGLVPSGGDGGNWLAVADDLVGPGAMAADVSYPVLVPALLALLEGLFGNPLFALTTTAVLAKSILVIATYVCARGLGIKLALTAAALVAFAGGLLEAYAWGAYPQILAQGLGLIAALLVTRFLYNRRTSFLLIGLALAGLTIACHLMVGALLGPSMLVATLHFIYVKDPMHPNRWREARVGLATSLPLVGLAAAVAVPSALEGIQPTINPGGLGYLGALESVTRDAPLPWVVIAVAGLGVPWFRHWKEPIASCVSVATGWSVTALVLFLVIGEPRALLVVQVGLVLLAAVAFKTLREYVRLAATARHSRRPGGFLWYRLLGIVGVSMAAGVVAGGIGLYGTVTDWYRVVDDSEIASLDLLNARSSPDDLVLSAKGNNGNPVGWWVQGYAQRRSYTAVDTSFLAFPQEIEQAEIANEFFGGDLSIAESMTVIEETGADLIVVDRRSPDAAWLGSATAGQFTVVDDSSNLVILRITS